MCYNIFIICNTEKIMKKNKCITSVGGQALIEGVMMKGPTKIASAIRKPDGEIETRVRECPPPKKKSFKTLPFVRGIFNFFEMMSLGYKELMYSADIAAQDEEESEPSKFEKWLAKVFGKSVFDVAMVIALVLGVALALALFILLPTFIGGLFPVSNGWRTVIESVLKVVIFIGYMAACSLMKEMRRVFEYHGAEHKTIACFEAGDEVTPENAIKHRRFHPRCGTNFITITVLLSIATFLAVSPLLNFLNLQNTLIRMLIKLLLLPVVVGISYELIKLAGRHDNVVTRIISAPGMLMQRITTKEPDLAQLECAITAFKLALDGDEKQ